MPKKNIVLQKKINGTLTDLSPSTNGSVVYVSDPNSTSSNNDTVLNTVLSSINGIAGSAIQTVQYSNGAIRFYKEKSTEVTTSTTPAFTVNVPKEQFLDAAKTEFIPVYKAAEHVEHNFNDETLENKPVLVLCVKSINENGTEGASVYSPIDLSSLIKTYIGSVHTTTNPIGITVNSNTGAISGSLAIQQNNNALKLNASGELYVEDLALSSHTTGGIVVQDNAGKMSDSGLVLKGSTESLSSNFTATTVVGALNELNGNKHLGTDGQIKIERNKTVSGTKYNNYLSIDHIAAPKGENTSLSGGEILIADEDGNLVASTINIDSISSSDVIAQKANKVTGTNVAGKLAKLDSNGDLAKSSIDETDLNNLITKIGNTSSLGTTETVVSAIKALQTDVNAHSTDDSLDIAKDSNGYDFKVNLDNLEKTASGSTAQIGEYSNSVTTLVEALNEVKVVADTALAGNGANYYVAKNGTIPTVTELDLIMQEI